MNNTNVLTALGIVMGVSGYSSQNGFYPQQSSAVCAIATTIFGILAKGIGKP